MALSIGEANAVNHVLDFFLGTKGSKTTNDQARASATLLAEHASKTLSAGLTAQHVYYHPVWNNYAAKPRKQLRKKGGA